jgi:hypothetical protein
MRGLAQLVWLCGFLVHYLSTVTKPRARARVRIIGSPGPARTQPLRSCFGTAHQTGLRRHEARGESRTALDSLLYTIASQSPHHPRCKCSRQNFEIPQRPACIAASIAAIVPANDRRKRVN